MSSDADATSSNVAVAPVDLVAAAIRRLEDMVDPNAPLQPIDVSVVRSIDNEPEALVHGPSSDSTSIHTTHFTPLETSLLYCLDAETTMRPELIQEIAEDNNPGRVKSEKDKAAYWVRTDGTPLLLSFPAILDTQGKYGRTGPYFNMIENTDENNFKRTKVLFELKLLWDNDSLYPPEAQEVSATTWMLLSMLREEVEEKRNMGLNYEQRAAVTEFWRAQDVLVVTSDPLFGGMGDPSKIDTPKITRSQLSSRAGMLSLLKSPGGSSSTTTPLSSPSKAPPSRGSSVSTAAPPLALQTMPDPHGRYANLIARHPHLKSTIVNPPHIRDQNSALILPSDYSNKLGNQTPVFVTVKLRLWEIAPQSEEKRATSGFKSRDGEENGSRIYQLVLHEMSLLPSNIPAHNIVPLKYNKDAAALDNSNGVQAGDSGNLGKGKKRASEISDTDNADRAKRARMGMTDSDIEMVDSDVFA